MHAYLYVCVCLFSTGKCGPCSRSKERHNAISKHLCRKLRPPSQISWGHRSQAGMGLFNENILRRRNWRILSMSSMLSCLVADFIWYPRNGSAAVFLIHGLKGTCGSSRSANVEAVQYRTGAEAEKQWHRHVPLFYLVCFSYFSRPLEIFSQQWVLQQIGLITILWDW